MIIRKDSPLRHLPRKLNTKQTLFLDAIRYCIEMADASHLRLKKTLKNLTTKYPQQKDMAILGPSIVKALIDAWSIVDTANRLRNLLDKMPMVKKKSPGFVYFLKQTNGVEDLRHIIQHLNKEIDRLIVTNSAVLGTLSWAVALDSAEERILSCYLRPGTLLKSTAPFAIPARNIQHPIDRITLAAGDKSVCLSDIMMHLARLASSIERELQKQFTDLPQATADLLLILEIKMGET